MPPVGFGKKASAAKNKLPCLGHKSNKSMKHSKKGGDGDHDGSGAAGDKSSSKSGASHKPHGGGAAALKRKLHRTRKSQNHNQLRYLIMLKHALSDRASLELPNMLIDADGAVEHDLERLDQERRLYNKDIPKEQLIQLRWSLGDGSDALVGCSKFESELLNSWCHPDVTADVRLIITPTRRAAVGNAVGASADPTYVVLAHRAILAANSGFFLKALKRAGARCRQLILDNIEDIQLFVVLLRWMYTGDIDYQRQEITIERVFDMANRLWCSDLVRDSYQHLYRMYEAGKIEDVFEDPDNLEEYYKLRQGFIKLGVNQVSANASRLFHAGQDLTLMQPDQLRKILADDRLVVQNEKEVFEAVSRWNSVQPETRWHYMGELLKCIRFYTMEPEDMIDCILEQPQMFENRGPLQNVIAEAFWIQTLINHDRPVDEFDVRPSRVYDPNDIASMRADRELATKYIFLSDFYGAEYAASGADSSVGGTNDNTADTGSSAGSKRRRRGKLPLIGKKKSEFIAAKQSVIKATPVVEDPSAAQTKAKEIELDEQSFGLSLMQQLNDKILSTQKKGVVVARWDESATSLPDIEELNQQKPPTSFNVKSMADFTGRPPPAYNGGKGGGDDDDSDASPARGGNRAGKSRSDNSDEGVKDYKNRPYQNDYD